jgi:hypothetical protein
MGRILTFEAVSAEQPYGVIVVNEGRATAYACRQILDGVTFGHAISWMRDRNPRPEHPMHVYIIGRYEQLLGRMAGPV